MNPSSKARKVDFLEKFANPKEYNTDECYTQLSIMDVVQNYVAETYHLRPSQMCRVFYKGAEFRDIAYPDGVVVVDNPPFSMLTKIVKWFNEEGVDYFLFAPTLTAFSVLPYCGVVITGARICYGNGAYVNTSFVTNLGGKSVTIDGSLRKRLLAADRMKKHNGAHPKYNLPPEVLTPARAAQLAERGNDAFFSEREIRYIRKLKNMKKPLFGGGVLIKRERACLLMCGISRLSPDNETIFLSDEEEAWTKQEGTPDHEHPTSET